MYFDDLIPYDDMTCEAEFTPSQSVDLNFFVSKAKYG